MLAISFAFALSLEPSNSGRDVSRSLQRIAYTAYHQLPRHIPHIQPHVSPGHDTPIVIASNTRLFALAILLLSSFLSLPESAAMTCTTTLKVNSAESFEEPALGSSYGTFDCSVQKARIQRRHSSYQPQQWSIDTDDIQVLLDRFLSQLGKRLDFFDRYGSFKIDSSLDCAYSTLRTVHDSCAHVSDEVIDAGWRRARVFVETLEERYRDALARKQTMEQKAREGVRLMESVLADLETRAYEVRASTLGAFASDVYQTCLLYTSPSPRDGLLSRMPSSA